MSQSQSVIIDGVRSPFGTKGGPLVGVRSEDLASQTLRGLLRRNAAFPVEKIADVSLGCVMTEATQGDCLGRRVAILAGLPKESCANVISRNCGSSMDAAHQVSRGVETGDYEAAIAGGVEDMFGIPFGGFNPRPHPELEKLEYYMSMGQTAENLARELSITRSEQEEYAMDSHRKALQAWQEGRFKNEIIPIQFNQQSIEKDSGPRQPNPEKIRSLPAVFAADGTVTAATSSPFTVGASAILIASAELASRLGIKPRARIVSRAIAGVDWRVMGMGPVPATEAALKRARLTVKDLDAIELNEAFAPQAMYCIRKGNWPMDRINLNGGALALGHPLGATGARLLVTLMNVLEQRKGRYGLATMCIGGGMGIATVIERL